MSEARLQIQRDGSGLALADNGIVVLQGLAEGGNVELEFSPASGVRAGFKLRGGSESDGLDLRGNGPLALMGLEIDNASVSVSRSDVCISAEPHAPGSSPLVFRLEPGAIAWKGVLEFEETLRCQVTAPASLNIRLHIDSPTVDAREQVCTLEAELDGRVFVLPSIAALQRLSASVLARVRADAMAALVGCLEHEASALEGALMRWGEADGQGTARGAHGARAQAALHEPPAHHERPLAGRGSRTIAPAEVAPEVAPETAYLSSRHAPSRGGARSVQAGRGAYLPARDSYLPASASPLTPAGRRRTRTEAGSYPPANSYLPASPARAGQAGHGSRPARGAYLPAGPAGLEAASRAPAAHAAAGGPRGSASPLELRAGRHAPAQESRRGLEPVRGGSPHHEAAKRLMRCKDLLTALRSS